MRTFDRTARIAEEVKKEVSDIIRNNLKDPRISDMATITSVKISKDLKYSKIYVSVYGDKQKQEDTISGLVSSSGYIRRELGKRLKIRTIPEISFELDKSLEYSDHISKLIKKISSEKEEVEK